MTVFHSALLARGAMTYFKGLASRYLYITLFRSVRFINFIVLTKKMYAVLVWVITLAYSFHVLLYQGSPNFYNK